MVCITIGLLMLAGIAVYLAVPGGTLWKQYLSEVKISMGALTEGDNERFTLECIARLPDLLRKHIIGGAYIGSRMADNMLIRFHNAWFSISPGKKPIRVQFMQVNFVKRPDRHAFLEGRIAGLPLQAKDSVLDGAGSMTGMLAKRFQLFRSSGDEMDQSQLITALADAVYMPSLFLQEYVSWRSIDDRTVEGTITWKGVSAKGQFMFDQSGNIICFETNDRYMDENGKGSSLVPWRVEYSDYKNQNGFIQPGTVKASWRLPDGDDTYFASDQIKICYTIKENEMA